MHRLSALVVMLLSTATALACGGSDGSGGTQQDGGSSSSSGGAGSSGTGGGGSSSSGSSGSGSGSSSSGSGGSSSGGDAGGGGNGCAAALGIDAGFYTCTRQFYVAPSGNDGNDGTSLAKAVQTLGGALKLPLQGGDCVTVESGTYDEAIIVGNSGSTDTCTGYVVFRSASPGAAKVVSADQYHTVMVNANYVMFDGFDMTDSSTGSAFVAGTNTVVNGHVVVYHHIAAVRNIAHDAGGAGLAALHSDYIRFEQNTVYNNSSRDPYDDSGIDLWEAQASDSLPGFHIVIRNNIAYQNGEWNVPNTPSDGEGIILDTFDYADATYGTTPYTAQTLVENNVVWGNGGRGIQAGPNTSYVTVRNNTLFDDSRQQEPWAQAELSSWGKQNLFDNNIVILGPDAKDGSNNGTTVALMEACGGAASSGNMWRNNIVRTVLSGNRNSYSDCMTTSITDPSNLFGVDPALAAPSLSATTADPFRIGKSSPAVHGGTAKDMAPFDYAYVGRPMPPSIGAFEP